MLVACLLMKECSVWRMQKDSERAEGKGCKKHTNTPVHYCLALVLHCDVLVLARARLVCFACCVFQEKKEVIRLLPRPPPRPPPCFLSARYLYISVRFRYLSLFFLSSLLPTSNSNSPLRFLHPSTCLAFYTFAPHAPALSSTSISFVSSPRLLARLSLRVISHKQAPRTKRVQRLLFPII